MFQIVRYERDGKQVVYKYLHPEWTILKSKTIPIGDDPNQYVQIIDGSGGHENLKGRIVKVIKYIDNNKTVVFRIP